MIIHLIVANVTKFRCVEGLQSNLRNYSFAKIINIMFFSIISADSAEKCGIRSIVRLHTHL